MGKSWKQSEGGVRFSPDAGKTVARVWTVRPGRDHEQGVHYAGVDPGCQLEEDDEGSPDEIRMCNILIRLLFC